MNGHELPTTPRGGGWGLAEGGGWGLGVVGGGGDALVLGGRRGRCVNLLSRTPADPGAIPFAGDKNKRLISLPCNIITDIEG